MQKLQLGKTDYQVTNLGLGCINFGTTTTEETAFQLIDTYLACGGNLLDTANNYAIWNGGKGRESETVIGNWIHANPSRRSEFVLATKLGASYKDPASGDTKMQGTGRKVIMTEVQKSLETMQTDYIDLLYLHVDDMETPQEETMEALAEVIRKGYVKAIGCSNFRTWRIERARKICDENQYPFFSAVQQRYTYLQPVMDADFGVQIAADKELESYLAYYKDLTMVSHTSLLYGAYFKDIIEDEQYDTVQNRKRLEFVRTQGKDAVGFVLKKITEQYGGSIALFTSNSVEHLKENIAFMER